MEAGYLDDPTVARMIRLAISRKRNLFDKYKDIDSESLFADMLGELGRSPYNPLKSKPGSFAYQVASRRLIDILRRRTNEDGYKDKAIAANGVRLAEVQPDEVREGTDAEMAESLIGFHTSIKDIFDHGGIPSRLPRCSPPDADRIQRAAILLLQRQQGWSCRRAETELKTRPHVLAAIGVTYCPSHTFFTRATKHCNIVAKNLSAAHPIQN